VKVSDTPSSRASRFRAHSVLGFYSFVARPMIEALDQLISMERPLKNLDAMQAHWNTKLVDEATEKEASVGKEGSTASLPASGPAGRSGSG